MSSFHSLSEPQKTQTSHHSHHSSDLFTPKEVIECALGVGLSLPDESFSDLKTIAYSYLIDLFGSSMIHPEKRSKIESLSLSDNGSVTISRITDLILINHPDYSEISNDVCISSDDDIDTLIEIALGYIHLNPPQ